MSQSRRSSSSASFVAEDEVATQLGEVVGRLSRRLRRASRPMLRSFELSDGQARTLRIIGHARSPLRMSEIARRIEVVPRSATSVVEVLERRGLVAREMDPEDRRSVLVRLTPAGGQLFASLGEARDEAASAIFATLELPDRLELLRLLRTVDARGDGESAGRGVAGKAEGSDSNETRGSQR
jgi:DNA-binding MarR family transcriptional regulator